jgi:serine/threonine-protein kinase
MGIVHRDLKPENIVLEPLRSGTDFVKVVDFGLAKILEADTAESGNGSGRALTRPGIVCGTPEYMSPEHARGDPLDGRSDLYALGVVLFELITGKVPFSSDSPTKTLLMHLTEAPPDPRAAAPDRAVGQPIAELVMRSMAKAREDRFQDASAFTQALERALLETEGRSVPPGRPAFNSSPGTALRCKACGTLNPLGQKFCGECGASIAASGKPAAERAAAQGPLASAPTMARGAALRSSSGPMPLVARDDALAWLESRRHQATVTLAAAHVVGDPGTGKTRLLGEFTSRCASRGDWVVSVSPDPSWTKVADHAVVEAIKALAGPIKGDAVRSKDAGPEARRGLEMLFGPALATRPTPIDRRRSVAAALRWALVRATERAKSRVVVLAVDDLDFVDGTSKNAFLDLLSDPPDAPALVVVTYAPGRKPAGDALPGESLTLAPLPAAVAATLVPADVLPPSKPVTPLHAEHLAAWARDTTDPPPDNLADLMVRRIQKLPAGARHALQALAVWGDGASNDVLRDLLPKDVDLPAALDALDRTGFVAIDLQNLRITHPLVRRFVASSIPAGLKRELYARVAELRPEAPLETRAKQAIHGGTAFEALMLLDSLSAKRTSLGDIQGTVSALRHALDLARRELHRGELDDPEEAVLVFARKLAEALCAARQWSDAEGVLREALGLAPPTSDHRAHLLAVLAQIASTRSQPREAREYLDEALRVAKQSNSRTLLPILEQLDKTIKVA